MATSTISSSAANLPSVCKNGLDTNRPTLVERAQRGDGDAFAELFELHKGRVYGLCLSMTKDASDAEDMTQEAFLQAFRKVAMFRGDSAFSTWLYRVAMNTVLMKCRRRNCPPMLSLDVASYRHIPHHFGSNLERVTRTFRGQSTASHFIERSETSLPAAGKSSLFM